MLLIVSVCWAVAPTVTLPNARLPLSPIIRVTGPPPAPYLKFTGPYVWFAPAIANHAPAPVPYAAVFTVATDVAVTVVFKSLQLSPANVSSLISQ